MKQLHYTSVRTHKNQSFSSHRPSNGKKIFVIPEMPSKTFVMVLKKLPDHFNEKQLHRGASLIKLPVPPERTSFRFLQRVSKWEPMNIWWLIDCKGTRASSLQIETVDQGCESGWNWPGSGFRPSRKKLDPGSILAVKKPCFFYIRSLLISLCAYME